MLEIPAAFRETCENPGKVTRLDYGRKFVLLYTPVRPAKRILYLIHGGGGDQYAFFRPEFLNMVDHMMEAGVMEPMYMVSPCFYDPDETDKTPGSSGKAVAKFCAELRKDILPLAEAHAGQAFAREDRIIGGFSMGGVTTWYAMLQALDLFYWFVPMSGDCWALGEKGGGTYPQETAQALADAVKKQGSPDFRIHAVTGSKDIAYPNLDPQIKAMQQMTEVFGKRLEDDVLENGVHDYETIFRYLYHVLPEVSGKPGAAE